MTTPPLVMQIKEARKMSMKNHIIWMVVGILGIAVASLFVGVNAWFLFPFICLLMMSVMMLGMDHDDDQKR